MDSRDPAALLPAVTELARVAGDMALRFFRSGQVTSASVSTKEGGSPVTEADLLVDRFLLDELGRLVPEAGWLSEETADTDARLSREKVFVVDPIDGTRAFAAGDPRWVVSIALVAGGRPILGVVHAPALGETYAAFRGGSATLNGARIRVSERADLDGTTIAGPKSLIEAVRRTAPGLRPQPRVPSLAYRFVSVATGALETAVASINSHDWDIAAADLILHEAGGVMVTPGRQRPSYNGIHPRHGVLVGTSATLLPTVTKALIEAGIT